MSAFPTYFPGAWQNIPVEIQEYLAARLLKQQLALHNGSAGLIRQLYAGHAREDLALHESWQMSAEKAWPFVLVDTERWLAKRAARATHPLVRTTA